ncbi:hypothetical protein FJ251_05660 [bacterium]|nr:hypothetical protein [bacterium]
MSARWRWAPIAAALFASGCGGESGAEYGRLHAAQRAYWQALRAQERLDIYPSHARAQACLADYLAVARAYPATALPRPLPADQREAPSAKIARVGAMAALGAAAIHWELGEREAALALLGSCLREDLPLGALAERRLRVTLSGYLRELGRRREAAAVLGSLLVGLAPGLEPGDAAYPDAELLGLCPQLADLALAAGDSLLKAEVAGRLSEFLGRLRRDYAGQEPAYQGLHTWAETAPRLGRWEDAEAALAELARGFPTREPGRAELQRARLLIARLERAAEGEAVLVGLAAGDSEAAVPAGLEYLRVLLRQGRLGELPSRLEHLHRRVRTREDRAELLYLWGHYEARLGTWDAARQRWEVAATELPTTPYGMEAQLAVARVWAERGEPRFAARSLARLFEACRRNTRRLPGSEEAGVSLALEARADSLLGTLPATEEAVRGLLARRPPAREGS